MNIFKRGDTRGHHTRPRQWAGPLPQPIRYVMPTSIVKRSNILPVSNSMNLKQPYLWPSWKRRDEFSTNCFCIAHTETLISYNDT